MSDTHHGTIVVVVNDEVLQLTLLTELLRLEGLEVYPHQSAEAALAAMAALPTPALIVTDLYMPGIDGWRFCRLLRSPSYPAYNQVPILVISATFAGEEASRIAFDLGANAFLPSPVAGDRLRATIQALLSGDKPREYQRILIVEDSIAQATLFTQAFTVQGYQVDTAPSVAVALEAFNQTAYDLALLDYHLPDGDGGMLLDSFRQQRPYCVCLVMTVDSSPHLALDLLKRGAAAFLNKPFDLGYLLEVSARALRERALLRVQDLLEERTRKLRDSEQRFRTMAKNAFDLVALLDEQGRYLFCNDSYLETFGYNPQELLGTLCFDRVHPDHLPLVMERIQRNLAEHRTIDTLQLDILHRQGHYLHIHYNARQLIDSQGNRQLLLNGRDITEQRAAEQALQRRDTLLKATAEIGRILLKEKDLNQALRQVVDVAGLASGQDRAYLFTVAQQQHTAVTSASILNEWVRPGVPPEIDNPDLQDIPFSQLAAHTFTLLSNGEIVSEHIRSLPMEEQQFLSAQDIQSILLVPIEVDDRFWGFIGFDSCTTEYCWSPGEQAVLLGMAAAIGGAVARQRSEQIIRDNEQRLRTLINATPDIILFKDGQGRWLEVNDATLELFCLKGVDYRGKTQTELAELTAPIFRQSLLYCDITDQRTWQQRTLLIDEEHIQRIDGTIKIYETSKMPIFAPSGERQALVVLGRDVTDRKQVERERERLIRAIEQTGETIVITDTQGEIQYANPAFERTTGYTVEEAQGRNPRLLKSGVHDDRFYQEMWQTLECGDTWTGRIVNKRRDGSLYTEDAIISPVRNAQGATVSYVAVKRDVTEAIKLEEQYRQAQKMESIGRLAGGVAHDFNNMLGVILGRTEMCLEEISPSDPLRHFLKDIHQAASRSANLTRQLLAFARKQTLTPQVLNLNGTIANMLTMLNHLIGENIILTWRPAAELWPVCIDPSQIDQILANLCVNARDAIQGIGTINIATENCHLEEGQLGRSAAGDYVCLRVTDNGCGMDKDLQALIFDPFFTTKEVGKGTGLGLATIYGIVQQHQGIIDVQSSPGQGTTFAIYFPSHLCCTDTPLETDTDAVTGQSRETILLVEDEPLLLEMTSDMLQRQGYHVLEASDPREAVNIASTHTGPIHLLLTDIIMPVMNGLELAKQLASISPGLKQLFMSGYTADVIAHHGILKEGIHFIQKPFILKELAEKVREVLENIE